MNRSPTRGFFLLTVETALDTIGTWVKRNEPDKGNKMSQQINRIGDKNAKHLYEVGLLYKTERSKIEVLANNRPQAAKLAKRPGFAIDYINLIG